MIHREEMLMQSRIIRQINKDNINGNTPHFDWDRTPFTPSLYVLRVITVNTKTDAIFCLKSVEGKDQGECYRKMLDYVTKHYKEEENYTVTWIDEEGKEQKSYFRGTSEEEVKEKFNYQEHTNATIKDIKPGGY